MKRLLIIMILLLAFLLFACGSSANDANNEEVIELTTWDTFYDSKDDVLKMYDDFMKTTLEKTNLKMVIKLGKGDKDDVAEICEIDGTTAKITTEAHIKYAYIKDGQYYYAITYKEDGGYTQTIKDKEYYYSTYNLYKRYTFSRYESYIDKKNPKNNSFEFTSEGKTYLERGITNKEEFITMTIRKYNEEEIIIFVIEAKAKNGLVIEYTYYEYGTGLPKEYASGRTAFIEYDYVQINIPK